jgi:hypothetical protein
VPEGAGHPALRRVLREAGDPALADKLAALPGSDLTTVLLEVQRRRADRVSAPDVLRSYGRDRFVGLAAAGFGAQRQAEDALLAASRSRRPSARPSSKSATAGSPTGPPGCWAAARSGC